MCYILCNIMQYELYNYLLVKMIKSKKIATHKNNNDYRFTILNTV